MPAPPAEEALELLREGNRRFLADEPIAHGRDSVRRRMLAQGQEPFAAILCCADSRVVPELAFDTGLGELFVLRVAGNVANKATIASLEYALSVLHTKLVVVMAHGNCGAVAAAASGERATPHLHYLLDYIEPALDPSGTDDIDAIARRNATLTAGRLVDESEVLAECAANRGVRIVPAFYETGTGRVDFL